MTNESMVRQIRRQVSGKVTGTGDRLLLLKQQCISCTQISALSHLGLDRGHMWGTDGEGRGEEA